MKAQITIVAVALVASNLAYAAVSAEEATRLGKDLTLWGAEKAGNKEGTIPAYTGGMPVDILGAGFDSNKSLVNGKQFQPDPFKDEKPLFRITAKNLAQYADNLSETAKGLFRNDPNFFMDVYPTHRVVNYPKFYLDETLKNATRCKTEQDGNAIKSCKGGMPFPIPKTGAEAMWNLVAGNYQGWGVDQEGPSIYVDRNGAKTLSANNLVWIQYPYQDPRYTLEDFENANTNYARRWFRAAYDRIAPARIAGEGNIIHFFTDNTPVSSWVYQPGNRRVRVAPNVAYDFPLASAGGAAFYDEANIFQGRLDRFDWKLLGKREMIMPYSNYKLAWSDYNKAMVTGHPNPEMTRWELHRAWVVEGTRKAGARHAFSKRRYYIDEDGAGALMSDQWDDSGKVVRGGFQSMLWIPDYQLTFAYFWNCDLASGAYWTLIQPGNAMVKGLRFRKPDTGVGGFNNGPMYPDSEFTPEALPRRIQR